MFEKIQFSLDLMNIHDTITLFSSASERATVAEHGNMKRGGNSAILVQVQRCFLSDLSGLMLRDLGGVASHLLTHTERGGLCICLPMHFSCGLGVSAQKAVLTNSKTMNIQTPPLQCQ